MLLTIFFAVLFAWSTAGIGFHFYRIFRGASQTSEVTPTLMAWGFVFGLSSGHLASVLF